MTFRAEVGMNKWRLIKAFLVVIILLLAISG
jgi:hypothetical protein